MKLGARRRRRQSDPDPNRIDRQGAVGGTRIRLAHKSHTQALLAGADGWVRRAQQGTTGRRIIDHRSVRVRGEGVDRQRLGGARLYHGVDETDAPTRTDGRRSASPQTSTQNTGMLSTTDLVITKAIGMYGQGRAGCGTAVSSLACRLAELVHRTPKAESPALGWRRRLVFAMSKSSLRILPAFTTDGGLRHGWAAFTSLHFFVGPIPVRSNRSNPKTLGRELPSTKPALWSSNASTTSNSLSRVPRKNEDTLSNDQPLGWTSRTRSTAIRPGHPLGSAMGIMRSTRDSDDFSSPLVLTLDADLPSDVQVLTERARGANLTSRGSVPCTETGAPSPPASRGRWRPLPLPNGGYTDARLSGPLAKQRLRTRHPVPVRSRPPTDFPANGLGTRAKPNQVPAPPTGS